MPQTHLAGVIFAVFLEAVGNQPYISPETPEKKEREGDRKNFTSVSEKTEQKTPG